MVRLPMSTFKLAGMLALLAGFAVGVSQPAWAAGQQSQTPAPSQQISPEALDKLLAPIALYPDALLGQILLCSTSPYQVRQLHAWLKRNSDLKGSALQEAAQKEGFDPSFVALAVFPQVVTMMAEQADWTRQLGEAFKSDRKAVAESVQRLRERASAVGSLQSTPQQEVKTVTTQSGQEVIVIQPANPQVIYVPQYNPQVVYTQPAPTTVVVHEEDDSDAVAAAVIGFTAGVIVGAAADNYYYWGPYGWYGGGAGYWYAEAWDDWYDHREEMAEDWYEHREDMAGERTERQDTRQTERSERQGTRQEQRTERQGQRQENLQGGQATPAQQEWSRAQQPTTAQQATRQQRPSTTSNYEARGYGQSTGQVSRDRSGTGSGSFSGYGSGSSTRSASSRGRSSMSSRGGGRRR